MSQTLRRRCRRFWGKSSFEKKIHRDMGHINVYGPSFFKAWFTKSNRLEWRRKLKDKNFDFDKFVAPIRRLEYWW